MRIKGWAEKREYCITACALVHVLAHCRRWASLGSGLDLEEHSQTAKHTEVRLS